jgi:hypothetical protein
MVQPEVIFIRRPPCPSWDSFTLTRTPRCRHVPFVPPRNLRPGFETQTRKPATDGFEVQTTKPPVSSILHTRPPPLDTCHRRPRSAVRQVLLSPARLACPPSWFGQHSHFHVHLCLSMSQMSTTAAGHPASWSLGPSLTSVLHRSWSIDTARPYLTFISPSTTVSELQHLHTTSQETCRTTQLTLWLVTNST